jgi:hypothetical protein
MPSSDGKCRFSIEVFVDQNGTHRSEGRVVTALAAQVRRLYIMERRRYEQMTTGRASNYSPGPWWDGGETRRGTRRESIWPRVASFILRNHLDPATFISRQFITGKSVNPAPMPNQLLTKRAIENYELHGKDSQRLLEVSFETQKQALQQAILGVQQMAPTMHTEDVQAHVLLNGQYNLSPLFRYCLALAEGHPTIAKRYCENAILQYMQQPGDYDVVWGKWIPRLFKQRAPEVFAQIIEEGKG